MRILSYPVVSIADTCPYLADQTFRQEYFSGTDLNEHQFQVLLDQRWRRFGTVFFRPVCPLCRKCRPIRIVASMYLPGRSQRRVLKKNLKTKVVYRPLQFKEEIFSIYKKHSRERFDQESSREEFLRNFYNPGVPSFQSEYYVNGVLAAFGILDQSVNGLSSVYFCFDPDYSEYSLGTYSIIREIRETAARGLQYYYLGYFIKETPRMAYKGRFYPYELLVDGSWSSPEGSEKSVGTPQEVDIKKKQ